MPPLVYRDYSRVFFFFYFTLFLFIHLFIFDFCLPALFILPSIFNQR